MTWAQAYRDAPLWLCPAVWLWCAWREGVPAARELRR